jgi:bifunctional non-homologous end joining protein LigD
MPRHPYPRRPPGFIEPCLPIIGHKVPDGPLWAHEIKHDGYRFIVRRDGDQVHAWTRRGNDWTDRVPRVAAALRALPVTSATIDGEIVVCGERGVADFDLLRVDLGRHERRRAFLYAFDLLELDGHDLRRESWESRRAALARLLSGAEAGIVLSAHIDGNGPAMFEHVRRLGLEGVVSKRRDRPYRSGRSPDWVKVKNPDAPSVTRLVE